MTLHVGRIVYYRPRFVYIQRWPAMSVPNRLLWAGRIALNRPAQPAPIYERHPATETMAPRQTPGSSGSPTPAPHERPRGRARDTRHALLPLRWVNPGSGCCWVSALSIDRCAPASSNTRSAVYRFTSSGSSGRHARVSRSALGPVQQRLPPMVPGALWLLLAVDAGLDVVSHGRWPRSRPRRVRRADTAAHRRLPASTGHQQPLRSPTRPRPALIERLSPRPSTCTAVQAGRATRTVRRSAQGLVAEAGVTSWRIRNGHCWLSPSGRKLDLGRLDTGTGEPRAPLPTV